MFARTERLLLRPAFAEDAPARLPLLGPAHPALPRLLIVERTAAAPRVIGAGGLIRRPSGTIELGLWIVRSGRGHGFATEAGRALVDIARALRLPRIEASHFVDDPALGRVLEKLGFVGTSLSAARHCAVRGEDVTARLYRLILADGDQAIAA